MVIGQASVENDKTNEILAFPTLIEAGSSTDIDHLEFVNR
jgi:hypothetical protein